MALGLTILLDAPQCTGCRLCEIVCSVYHEGVVNPKKARIRVNDDYEHSLFLPHICQLCQPTPCVEACPSQALTQDIETGVIRINDQLCSGCGACVEVCPYSAIWWDTAQDRLFLCDRCGGNPQCTQFCTSGALTLRNTPQSE